MASGVPYAGSAQLLSVRLRDVFRLSIPALIPLAYGTVTLSCILIMFMSPVDSEDGALGGALASWLTFPWIDLAFVLNLPGFSVWYFAGCFANTLLLVFVAMVLEYLLQRQRQPRQSSEAV